MKTPESALVRCIKVWSDFFAQEKEKEYFKLLLESVGREYQTNTICPPMPNMLRVFSACSFDKIKVVILGQDPRPVAGQANGLAFAVNDDIPIPTSLRNIFKEVESDTGQAPTDRTLQSWAEQGVMLLSCALTVQQDAPGSHETLGWHQFTDNAIKCLLGRPEPIVFMLWGNHAKKKIGLIERNFGYLDKPLVLTASDPSPSSANQGFFGCKHFSKANEWLRERGVEEIKWA